MMASLPAGARSAGLSSVPGQRNNGPLPTLEVSAAGSRNRKDKAAECDRIGNEKSGWVGYRGKGF